MGEGVSQEGRSRETWDQKARVGRAPGIYGPGLLGNQQGELHGAAAQRTEVRLQTDFQTIGQQAHSFLGSLAVPGQNLLKEARLRLPVLEGWAGRP